MKNLRFVILALMMFVTVSGYSQDTKAERRSRRAERREMRRIERAVIDSLRLLSMENDSVNVGYGYARKKDLTTSVSRLSISRNEISSYTHIAEYLAGRVPGLSVTKTGSGYRYLIRGVNTINGSNDPLFVVDGMEVMDIDYLNPRDVQSVEVLKDASASIYGTRGACGVILITTKRTAD